MRARPEFLNPTNGSWWIVQIWPPKQSSLAHPKANSVSEELLPGRTGWIRTIHQLLLVGFVNSEARCCRLDLNHPPTPVTPVGGISEFSNTRYRGRGLTYVLSKCFSCLHYQMLDYRPQTQGREECKRTHDDDDAYEQGGE